MVTPVELLGQTQHRSAIQYLPPEFPNTEAPNGASELLSMCWNLPLPAQTTKKNIGPGDAMAECDRASS